MKSWASRAQIRSCSLSSLFSASGGSSALSLEATRQLHAIQLFVLKKTPNQCRLWNLGTVWCSLRETWHGSCQTDFGHAWLHIGPAFLFGRAASISVSWNRWLAVGLQVLTLPLARNKVVCWCGSWNGNLPVRSNISPSDCSNKLNNKNTLLLALIVTFPWSCTFQCSTSGKRTNHLLRNSLNLSTCIESWTGWSKLPNAWVKHSY